MHLSKIKTTDLNVLAEAAREHRSKVGKIDPERTHLNYNLAPQDNRIHNAEEIHQRIHDLGVTRKIKSDAVVALSTIIDVPQDYEGDTRLFFEAAYRALVTTLCGGEESRVLQAYVHLDEKTPHMHFASIPIVEKEGKRKLSAKELVDKSFLKSFHATIGGHMTNYLKNLDKTAEPVRLYSRDLTRKRTEARHKGDHSYDYVDIEELKARGEAEAHLQGLAEQTKQTQEKLEQTQKKLGHEERKMAQVSANLEDAKEELDEKITEGQAQIDALNAAIRSKKEEERLIEQSVAEKQKQVAELDQSISRKQSILGKLEDALMNLVPRWYRAYERIKAIMDSQMDLFTFNVLKKRVTPHVQHGMLAQKILIEEAQKEEKDEELIDQATADLQTSIEDLEEDEEYGR
jgi:predicted  nucleic acid-binding Zn-ribbon protein